MEKSISLSKKDQEPILLLVLLSIAEIRLTAGEREGGGGTYLEPKVIKLQSEHLTQPAKIAPR